MSGKIKKIILQILIIFGIVFSSVLTYLFLVVVTVTCYPNPPINMQSILLGVLVLAFVWLLLVILPVFYYVSHYSKQGDGNEA